jgi:hypothetical protein
VTEIKDDPNALAAQIAPLRGVVLFDGWTGVGKTALAHMLSEWLGCAAIDVDDYVDRNRGYFVNAIRFDELRATAADALKQSALALVSTICARDVAKRLGVPVAAFVYVEQRSSMGLPANAEITDAEDGGPDAFAEYQDLPPLEREIFDYHAAFKPRKTADILYIRTAD